MEISSLATQCSEVLESTPLDTNVVSGDNLLCAEIPESRDDRPDDGREMMPVAEALEIIHKDSMASCSTDEKMDVVELMMCSHPNPIDLPLVHTITPGLYGRQIEAPAGVLASTYIHKQEHQFILSKGRVSVFYLSDTEPDQVVTVEAPYHGITKVGTRRFVYVWEDAVWTTFHPTELTDIDEIEKQVYDMRTLPDGTNIRDRFRAALESKKLYSGEREELAGGTN